MLITTTFSTVRMDNRHKCCTTFDFKSSNNFYHQNLLTCRRTPEVWKGGAGSHAITYEDVAGECFALCGFSMDEVRKLRCPRIPLTQKLGRCSRVTAERSLKTRVSFAIQKIKSFTSTR
ncbi:hypothetical protein Zmor_012953 [Zophobas morio]|uniref:Uncharacterized protein n=1 Tax=Zophobas morio TaxID=2755281 RepID=A0AA38IEP1_9CUCU|nr:hypothetical protein Zmor_012953 [Zophobas morio]